LRALKVLATERDTTLQELSVEALKDMLAKQLRGTPQMRVPRSPVLRSSQNNWRA